MLAVATAVYGRVADPAGIRLPLVVVVGVMTASALLGALVPSYELLLAARLLQGTGAAAVPVLGMAVVSARDEGGVRTTALGKVAGTVSCSGSTAACCCSPCFRCWGASRSARRSAPSGWLPDAHRRSTE